jgi:hypothetical protein
MVTFLLLRHAEANASRFGRRVRGFGELANGGDQLADAIIVAGNSLLQFRQLGRQFLMRQCELPQLHKGADNEYADVNGARRVQDCCRHDGAVFGEGKRKIAPSASSNL